VEVCAVVRGGVGRQVSAPQEGRPGPPDPSAEVGGDEAEAPGRDVGPQRRVLVGPEAHDDGHRRQTPDPPPPPLAHNQRERLGLRPCPDYMRQRWVCDRWDGCGAGWRHRPSHT